MSDAALIGLLRQWAERGETPVIGVAGAQGSGKSTLCAAAARALGAAHFSIDDVYLTRTERTRLAQDLHPMCATRGPPGTHDLALAEATVQALRRAGAGSRIPIPSFDKLADDRRPPDRWPVFEGRPSAILVDGWCVGATAEAAADLARPVNDLERERDPEGVWRAWANDALAGTYARFFVGFDAILLLAAPSWEVVLDWRSEQEAGLLGIAPAALPTARRAEIATFIAHYERITRHMLAGGARADAVANLAQDRSVRDLRRAK